MVKLKRTQLQPSLLIPQTNQNEKTDQIDMKKLSEAFGNFIGRNLQSPGFII